MKAAGRPYRLPPREPLTPAQHAPLVVALGLGWKDAAEVLPWQDGGLLRYVVYSPAYGGTLLLCQFQVFSPARWWHDGMQVGISGVTCWRLATEDDQDFSALDGPPSVTPSDPEALAQLRHWWRWYSAYKGFDPE
ncbi:hypothetical protein [Pseudomonas sp. NPDC099000]|uniref:hypothetical protein n=1 Tax=Pseudomonas sp. NPDC099000 TaxID=3364488 RepID=UPI00383AC1BB